MASSSLALRRLLSSSVVPHSLRFVRLATASRLFNTNRKFKNDDDGNHRSIRPVSRSRGDSLLDIFYPLTPTRSLKEVLNSMNQFFKHPLIKATQRYLSPRVRRGWNVEEKDDALYLKFEYTGLSREDVKVALEHFMMVIRGQGKKEKIYKTNEIKAEMKKSVLTLMAPKIKVDLKDPLWDLLAKVNF